MTLKTGYLEIGDKVQLTMTREDFESLLMRLGGSARGDIADFHRTLALVNRLNVGNKRFTPYEVPEEYR